MSVMLLAATLRFVGRLRFAGGSPALRWLDAVGLGTLLWLTVIHGSSYGVSSLHKVSAVEAGARVFAVAVSASTFAGLVV